MEGAEQWGAGEVSVGSAPTPLSSCCGEKSADLTLGESHRRLTSSVLSPCLFILPSGSLSFPH